MSTRRLRRIVTCATCAISFRPLRKEQKTCSQVCGAIRRVKLYPHHHLMLAANRKNRERFDAQLEKYLEGFTVVDAYKKGRIVGYRAGYQRRAREVRKSA